MSLPQIPYTQRRKEPQITEFRGVNYRDGIRDGEMQFTENMSSRRFPFLSPRQDRLSVRDCYAPLAVWAGDKLLLVDNGKIYYDVLNDGGPTVIGSTSGDPKQFAAINSKLVIWPDKQYIDLNTGTLKDLEAAVETLTGSVTTFYRDNRLSLSNAQTYEIGRKQAVTDVDFETKDISGTSRNYFRYYSADDEDTITFSDGVWTLPQNPEGELSAKDIYDMTVEQRQALIGKIVMLQKDNTSLNLRYEERENGEIVWQDDYTQNNTSGLYASITGIRWKGQRYPSNKNYEVTITYDVREKVPNQPITERFSVGDTVTVERVHGTHRIYVDHGIVREIDDETNTLTFDPGTFADLFADTSADEITTYNAIRVKRTVPDMDFICASENRLWGVSNAEEGQVWDREKKEYVTVHNRVIHASALGDPTNFYVYDGLSTDSYSVAVAETGDFTGCVGFSGDVLFFKERKLYRIYGDYPATYMMYTYDVPGVTAGSHMSVGIVNDTLFYLSREGVHVWDGASAHLVSYKLGPGPFSDGVAGVCGTRYYLSMKEDDVWSLHVYDTLHDVWYREDDTQAIGFAEHAGNFYMLHDQTLDQLEIDSISQTAVQYRQWGFYWLRDDFPGTCWSYSGTGTLTAGTYHFRAGDKTWQFTSTEDVNLGLYNLVLYTTNIRRCQKTGGYSTMSWSLREGNGGAELDFQEVPTAVRIVFQNEFALCFTLPCDIPQGRGLMYNTTWPDRIDIQETDNGGYVQVPVTVDSGYYVYSTTLGDNVPPTEYAGPKGPSQWRAVLATADEVIHERKHYRWIRLRAEVPKGSTLRVYAAIGNGEDRLVYTMSRKDEDFSGTINIPLQAAVRDDKIRITLEGIGDATIKSVVRAYNMGSVNTK